MPLLDIHPRELKTGVYKSTCVHMFKAALLIMAQNWKKLKLASESKWVNNEIGLSHKKEENTDSCRATDETSQHCAVGEKLNRKRPHCIILHVWSPT